MYLVTGGGGLYSLTAATEIMEKGGSSWTVVESADLAIPLFGMRGVKLDNKVYMIGQLWRSHKTLMSLPL